MGSTVPGNATRLPARKAVVGRQLVIPREGIRPLPRILYYLVCTILAMLFVFPLFWSIFTSLKPTVEANASPANIIPSHLSFDNYIHLANYGSGIGTYLYNSGVVAIGTVFGTILLSTLAGYGFSRFTFPGKDVVFMVILSTLMIP